MPTSLRRLAAFCAVLSAVALGGCNSPVAPGIQSQVNNAPDNFQYQTTSVRTYTGTASYSWSNSGTRATINQATTVTGGTMTLTITDNAGTQVYSNSMANNGTFQTSPVGVAGMWTIRIDYVGANGTVNFRVQKL